MRREYPLHDATFDGIILSGKNATLYFTTSAGNGSEVTLHEMDALQIDDFREGNIVVFFGETCNERLRAHSHIERLYLPPHPSASEEYHAQYRAFLESKVASIEGGSLSFVEMDPAMGATMLATCKRVTLVER